jgi:hypothetical protein
VAAKSTWANQSTALPHPLKIDKDKHGAEHKGTTGHNFNGYAPHRDFFSRSDGSETLSKALTICSLPTP